MSPNGNRLLVVALLAGLLASGAALGVALDRLWLRPEVGTRTVKHQTPKLRGEARERLLLGRFKKQLGLDADQTTKVGAQIHRMFTELDTIRSRAFADLKKVRTQRRAEIMKVLTPAQQKTFRDMITAYERRKSRRRKHRH